MPLALVKCRWVSFKGVNMSKFLFVTNVLIVIIMMSFTACIKTQSPQIPASLTTGSGTCTGSGQNVCSIRNGSGIMNSTCINGAWVKDGDCYVNYCNDGYTPSYDSMACEEGSGSGTCSDDETVSCSIANGKGEMYKMCLDGTFYDGTCEVTSCNTGYTPSWDSTTCEKDENDDPGEDPDITVLNKTIKCKVNAPESFGKVACVVYRAGVKDPIAGCIADRKWYSNKPVSCDTDVTPLAEGEILKVKIINGVCIPWKNKIVTSTSGNPWSVTFGGCRIFGGTPTP